VQTPVIQIGNVAVDASLREVHSLSGEATEHPVEAGSNISDNNKRKPRRFQIDGVITNHPINLPRSQVDGVSEADVEFYWEANPEILGMEMGGGGLIGGALGAIASATGINQHAGMAKGYLPDFDRVQDCYAEFEAMWELGDPFDVYTSLRIYHNMVIETFDTTRDKDSGNALRFTMTVKQVRTVSTLYTAAPPEPLVERGKPLTNRGKQAARTVKPSPNPDDAATAAAGESAAHSLGGLLTGS